MTSLLDLDALHIQLRQFAEKTPEILRRVKLTDELAGEVERSMAIADAPFTLAVVGQMRVGKSTLINALVGAELAIPGVTETTATVNWFRHGTPEQEGKFRVVWNDLAGTSDEFDLSKKNEWLGNSELAAKTRFLEFYSTAEFLKRVHIVDTPGSRSTISSHEEAARGFWLSERKAERDSLFYGGVADCIVYTLPPVPHQNDSDLLGMFTSQRRLLQSTPYNSVGVLHKWETLDHSTPWQVAVDHARQAFGFLKSYLCDIIPVSGPLAQVSQRCPDEFWNKLLAFVKDSSGDTLGELMSSPSSFASPKRACPLSPEERSQLRSTAGIAWPCFRAILLIAASRSFADGEELRKTVREISGIDRFMSFLEERFFNRSRLIRASNVLNRTLRVTELGRGRLRNRLKDLANDREMGRQALAEFASSTTFPKAREFINSHLVQTQHESDRVTEVLRDLELQAGSVRDGFEHFEKDCRAVQCLDDHPDQFEANEAVEILTLLGGYGTGLLERLGVNDAECLLDSLHDRLDHWIVEKHKATRERRQVLDQVVTRLEEALRQVIREQDAR